jgi:hypothetical protein
VKALDVAVEARLRLGDAKHRDVQRDHDRGRDGDA